MERSHGGLDQSVLNAGSATLPHPTHLQVSPGLHSVLGVRPSSTLASMQLSYPAAISVDRIKRDDVGSDAPAVLSLPIQTAERTRLLYAGGESMRPYPALAGFHELTGNRSVVPRPVPSQLPACNIIDFVSASNAFTFLMAQADAPPLCASSPLPLVSPGKLRTCEQVPHRSVEDGPISESCSKSMGPSSPSKLRNNQIVLHTENPNISSLKTDIGPLADKLGECTSGSLPPPKLCTDDVSDYPCSDSPISLDSPDKQDAIISSEEVSGTHRHEKTHMQSSYKRRKTQQKRVVFVPVGDVKQMKGETPPSDSWAWRKYGQKPIKGSPYPRLLSL
ncbi:hypothetical protein KP509_09G022900 [Ceratopteris richardii]|uniref:WRKY domain-containing protein n=1 Tax=Ceratopteris richardii TaxID=49495 RepID=A0A8T2U663_CERRI|nr:hypothetical protein KP509_09G022900 [Ceratopteris richardii]